jgi:hypothetical protein
MKRIIILILSVFISFSISGKKLINKGDSVVEFPVIVLVGQVVEINPYSIVFENTYTETRASKEQISDIVEFYSNSVDFRAHGLVNALRAVSVKDGKMRFSLYLDNILKIFDDDVSTYMKFIPVYYMFRNNIKEMNVPKKVLDELKKFSLDYYLSIPMAQELMKNSWIAGVFQIDPQSSKLVYKSARFFNDFNEMSVSEWANGYRIPDIVRAGMIVTMTKAVVIGKESQEEVINKDKDSEKGDKKNKKVYNKKYDVNGQEK